MAIHELCARLTAGLLATAAGAQSPIAKAPLDPYTGGEPTALAKAGYRSLGPFPFGGAQTTTDVEALLGGEPLAWIETRHFRIGCSLSPRALKVDELGDAAWIDGVRAELKRLSARLPRVNVATRELDPWLRAHLVAQRAEELYAQVMSILGVDDSNFPAYPGDMPGNAREFRGKGPYLGMASPFRILLLRRAASHARFTRAYHGREVAGQIRFHDLVDGSLYWGGSEETDGVLNNDLALQAHLAFNVAHNLYTGYRAYGHDLPAWLPTGLGHWHSRQISPRFLAYDRRDEQDHDPRSPIWDWDKRVAGLAKNCAFESLTTFLDRDTAGTFGLEQHIQAWSLADFLMSQRRDQVGRFLSLMKEPFHALTKLPTPAELHFRQLKALTAAFSLDVTSLTDEWRTWLLKGRRPAGR